LIDDVVNARRIVNLLYAVVLLAIGLGAGRLFYDARVEYNHLQRAQTDLRRRLADAKTRLAEQERALERLKTDPAYVQKTLRQYNYAKPDEFILRFPD
jgi:cell division protein FtsB